MGGRGLWAQRRRTGVVLNRVINRPAAARETVFRQSTRQVNRATGGAGDITDEQARAALGASFTRADVRSILGADAAGAITEFTVTGNAINASITNRASGYRANLSLSRGADGSVTFTGGSLFADASNNNNAAGSAIRSFRSGLAKAVQRGLVDKLVVPNAIGSAGDRSSQGSNLWARMGASAPLSALFGSGYASRLPPSLRGAREVADLMQSKEGRRWWSDNRVSFRGEINFKNKNSSAYKVAKRFLGRGN